MKRRVLSLALAVLMLLTLLPVGAMADGATSGTYTAGGISYTLSAGTLTVSGTGTCSEAWKDYFSKAAVTEVIIENGITALDSYSFSKCNLLERVSVADSVTELGWGTFEHCSALTSVNIPSGVTEIGDCIFSGCSSLTEVLLPYSVTSIGYEAFSGCTSLESITIPGNVTNIGNRAFWTCTSLTSAVIPDKVTEIGIQSFCYCTSLESVVIPDSVTKINDGAFLDCRSLSSVSLGIGITYICMGAFESCPSLANVYYAGSQEKWNTIWIDELGNDALNTAQMHYGSAEAADDSFSYTHTDDNGVISTVEIKDGVCKISSEGKSCTYAFSGGVLTVSGNGTCSMLWKSFFEGADAVKRVVIEGGVRGIGEYAFSNCAALASVTIPDSVKSIGDAAFANCKALKSASIPDSVTGIGASAFKNTGLYNDAANRENGVLYIDGCAADADINVSGACRLKDGTRLIAAETFYFCKSLTGVSIPGSVTSIGRAAFVGCTSLKEITVAPDNKSYQSSDGVLYNKQMSELIGFPAGKSGSFAIPDGIKSIADETFSSAGSLTSITIPGSVTSIGSAAFNDCTALMSVTIPDSVKSIGASAFRYCTALKSVTIPGSVKSIEPWAFEHCTSLASADIGNGVTSIGIYAFNDCRSLKSIGIPDSVASIGVGAFDDTGFADDEANWENGVLYIDGCLVDAKSELSGEYEITDGTKVIANGAFGHCILLTSVTIPRGVTGIGNDTFGCCSALERVTIPDSVTSIGDWAFMDCAALTDVYYGGTQEQWNAISIGEKSNDCLKNATVHYNSAPQPTTVPGDINGDGTVNVLDLIRLKKHLAGADVELVGSADVNGDGAVNVLDLIRLKKFLAGADVTLN